MLDTTRRHYDSSAAARQIVAHLATLGRANRVVIENDDIRRHSRQETPALLDAEEIGRLGGYALDRAFEAHHLPVAHPRAEQIGAIPRVEQRHRELDLQLVLESEVEERIDTVLAALLGNRRDGLAFERLHRGIEDFLHLETFPVAAEDDRLFEFLAERVAETRVAVDFRLRFLGLIEDRVPARQIREDEGVAQIDLDYQRTACHLRDAAAPDERFGLAQRLHTYVGLVVAIQHCEPRHRATALSQQKIEEFVFLFVQHRDRLGERKLHCTLAEFLERVGVCLELVTVRVTACERPSLVADMLRYRSGSETERAGCYRFLNQRLYPGGLLTRCRTFHRLLAHYEMAKRSERRHEAKVDTRAAPLGRVEILREGLPFPFDSLTQHLERDPFDVDEVPRRYLAYLRTARRDAYAAIAHDHRGYAVPRRRRDVGVPADLGVVMGVRIDEAGRDDEVRGVDNFLRALGDLANLGDPAIRDRDIRAPRRSAGTIDHCSVLDQQIIRH